MRNFDFSSWQGVLSTLFGLAIITLLGVGIRLLVMQTVQQRRADTMEMTSSDRSRRIRDAVEAALSDIILLGTEEQVRLAARAADDLVAGRPAHTDELVISLRNFIRTVLDLDPVSADIAIPKQGPARPGAAGAGKRGEAGGQDREKSAGGKSGDAAAGAGAGMGLGLGVGIATDDDLKSSD